MEAHRSFVRSLIVLVGITLISIPTSINAGGLIGDAINVVVPGAGTKLDNIHKQIKDNINPYKMFEEGVSHTVNETLVQSGAPLLEKLIIGSKNDALRAGVKPIPEEIRRNLEGFISDNALSITRYRVKGGGDLSLQVNAIRYGEANAITLDYVIVFKELNDALFNTTLWVHELTHVEQFHGWGIKDFSIRYLRDHRSVEREAYGRETRYAAWVGEKNSQQWASTGSSISSSSLNRPVSPFSFNSNSSTCGTSVTTCHVDGSAPVGTPCWCSGTALGVVMGSLIPSTFAASPAVKPPKPKFPPIVPSELPSGYGMQVCGCWGPNPAPIADEPRCASGKVRVNVCPGFCAPGHPLYAYVCL